MAKTKIPSQIQYPKPKNSLFLCCFGSLPKKTPMSSNITTSDDPISKHKRTSWFSWRRIRMKKNSATKMVPFEASVSDEKRKLIHSKPNEAHSTKQKSKSNLHKATNLSPPRQAQPELAATLNETPSQTRHGEENNAEDTRQQSRASPSHTKRQVGRLSYSVQTKTTSKQAQNARRSSYDPVVGMSVVMVTLVVMMLWGRLCAVLCTSAWFYFIHRFRNTIENDENDSNNNSNDMDLDSEAYKKKVIMEGLLERNHRSTQ